MSADFKLVPFDIYELKTMKIRRAVTGYTPRNIIKLIEEFVEMDCDCCKVNSYDSNRKAHTECTILRRTVDYGGFDNVKVILRGNSVYLVRKDRWDSLIC